jgi:hypothetical protein
MRDSARNPGAAGDRDRVIGLTLGCLGWYTHERSFLREFQQRVAAAHQQAVTCRLFFWETICFILLQLQAGLASLWKEHPVRSQLATVGIRLLVSPDAAIAGRRPPQVSKVDRGSKEFRSTQRWQTSSIPNPRV